MARVYPVDRISVKVAPDRIRPAFRPWGRTNRGEIISNFHIELTLRRQPHRGIWLEAAPEARLRLIEETSAEGELDTISPTERQRRLIGLLLTGGRPTTMQSLADEFFFSRATVQKDLDGVARWFAAAVLTLHRRSSKSSRPSGWVTRSRWRPRALGVRNEPTSAEIAAADLISFCVDMAVAKADRVKEKKLHTCKPSEAVKDATSVVNAAATAVAK